MASAKGGPAKLFGPSRSRRRVTSRSTVSLVGRGGHLAVHDLCPPCIERRTTSLDTHRDGRQRARHRNELRHHRRAQSISNRHNKLLPGCARTQEARTGKDVARGALPADTYQHGSEVFTTQSRLRNTFGEPGRIEY